MTQQMNIVNLLFKVLKNLKKQVLRIGSHGDQNTRTVQGHLFNVLKIP